MSRLSLGQLEFVRGALRALADGAVAHMGEAAKRLVLTLTEGFCSGVAQLGGLVAQALASFTAARRGKQ